MQSPWYAQGREDLLKQFTVSENRGLEDTEVTKRLSLYGSNSLEEKSKGFGVLVFFKQFTNPLVIILLVAFLGTLYLQETVDAFVIATALLVNVVIGFIQEYRAHRAFEALVSTETHSVLVLRAGTKLLVPTKELVPGDIIFLEPGVLIPADLYLLSSTDFSVSEAHLTGESHPVEKHTGILPEGIPVYERSNMLFMGSSVLSGTATGLTVATGLTAEVGRIAESLKNYSATKTPIEKSVERLARFLSLLIVGVIAILFLVGALQETPFTETLLLGIALAVSVVPEGLPAAVTAILAIGMEKILKKRGLVRNLLAAETLGSTTIILTDKTGTLTEAKMKLADIVTWHSTGCNINNLDDDQVETLTAALYASDALVLNRQEKTLHGQPTEKAIASTALDAGIYESAMGNANERIDFLKFSSRRRYAAALYTHEDHTSVYISGAPEKLLLSARYYHDAGVKKKMTEEARGMFKEKMDLLTQKGNRAIAVSVVTVAGNSLHTSKKDGVLKESEFLGIIAFTDPVRSDVPKAIKEVQEAGVRVVMVTGDTPKTALAIAQEVGIAGEEARVIIGQEIENMSDQQLSDALRGGYVFARILPHQKKRLVEVLQAQGEVVGMTGDGVNDAPALQSAAIGIAVGSGTEVAREASDLILLDDSFSIIVAAIAEGRRIMDNLKKAVVHLITTSFHEVFIISVAVLFALPLPILPVQILWVNILEEGFLTFGFAFEPQEKGIMKQKPQSQKLRTILTKEVKNLIILAGVITGVFSTGLFLWLLGRGTPVEEIRTIMFVVLSLDSLLFAFSLKQLHHPVWTANIFNNRYLLTAISASAVGIFITFAFEPLRTILSLSLPNTFDIVVLVFVAFVNIATIEISKMVVFRSSAKIPV